MDERLQRLIDIEEIKELKYKYAKNCADGFDADEIVKLFTEDCSWEGGDWGEAHGHAQLQDLWRKNAVMESWNQHGMINPLIEVNGDTAKGHWFLRCGLTTGDGQDMVCYGEYWDDYVKVDGKWLFKRIVCKANKWFPQNVG